MDGARADGTIRVALVIGQLHIGGSERQLFELASRLPGGPCSPWVYCLSEVEEPFGPRLREAGIPVRILPRRIPLDPRRVWALARALKQDRIVVVHSLSLTANLYGLLAARLAGGIPFIAANRANDPTIPRTLAVISRQVFGRSRSVVVNSEAGREFTSRSYHLPPERIEVIPNGVDLSRFGSTRDPALTRRDLGIPVGAPLAGTVGRISWEKGPDLFLEVAGRVSARHPDARFLIVGDGPMLPETRERARAARLGARVTFAGFRQDVPDLVAAMDVLMLTSSQEGMPNSVLEAMGAGRPVVATDVGGCRELVEPGVTGYLAPATDAGALAAHLDRLFSLPDRGRSLGEAGREKVRRRYTVESMIRAYQALFVRVAGEQQL